MSVTFFDNGLVVSNESAIRADAYCEATTLRLYRADHNGDDPPGWPSQAARKLLIEWSIKYLFSYVVRQWERKIAIANLEDPAPWEGPS